MTGLEHEDAITGRQGVDQSRLPGAGSGGRVDKDMFLGPEDRLHALQRPQADLAEIRTSVVNGLLADCAENSVWNSAWSGDLQEMAASFSHVAGLSIGCLGAARMRSRPWRVIFVVIT